LAIAAIRDLKRAPKDVVTIENLHTAVEIPRGEEAGIAVGDAVPRVARGIFRKRNGRLAVGDLGVCVVLGDAWVSAASERRAVLAVVHSHQHFHVHVAVDIVVDRLCHLDRYRAVAKTALAVDAERRASIIAAPFVPHPEDPKTEVGCVERWAACLCPGGVGREVVELPGVRHGAQATGDAVCVRSILDRVGRTLAASRSIPRLTDIAVGALHRRS
jgi:hypothetical protein